MEGFHQVPGIPVYHGIPSWWFQTKPFRNICFTSNLHEKLQGLGWVPTNLWVATTKQYREYQLFGIIYIACWKALFRASSVSVFSMLPLKIIDMIHVATNNAAKAGASRTNKATIQASKDFESSNCKTFIKKYTENVASRQLSRIQATWKYWA